MNLSKTSQKKYYGLGKRKEAIAKVYLFENGSGKIEVIRGKHDNYRTRDGYEYFRDSFLLQEIKKPIQLIKNPDSFDIKAHLKGGGIVAQAHAIRLGLAYALVEKDPENKVLMRANKFLTQDRRFKERKKIGKYGARRSPQFTKR